MSAEGLERSGHHEFYVQCAGAELELVKNLPSSVLILNPISPDTIFSLTSKSICWSCVVKLWSIMETTYEKEHDDIYHYLFTQAHGVT